MAKIFRQSTREATILSKIESSKEYAHRKAIAGIRDCDEQLSNAIAMKLVENNLSVNISGGLQATIDPFLYDILAITSPEKDAQLIINSITEEIDHIQNNSVTPTEINRAIKQAKALFAYGSDSITNQAFWMGYSSMFADHTWFNTYIENLEKVTKERILSTAQKYLDPNHRIIGIYRPSLKENKK